LALQLEDFVAWPVQEGPEFVRARILLLCAQKPRTALHPLIDIDEMNLCTLVLCDVDPGAWFECTAQGARSMWLYSS
jgi:hypothetical protein